MGDSVTFPDSNMFSDSIAIYKDSICVQGLLGRENRNGGDDASRVKVLA